MKYCEDCRWFDKTGGVAICTNEKEEKNHELSPVYRPTNRSCNWCRTFGNCGPEGKLWEGKE